LKLGWRRITRMKFCNNEVAFASSEGPKTYICCQTEVEDRIGMFCGVR
jgi:hypothetical protein